MRFTPNLKRLRTCKSLLLGALFLLFAIGAKSDPRINVIDSYKQALVILQKSDLIVVDLDATTFQSAQSLGSDEWYKDEVAKQAAAGLNPDEITQKLRPLADWVAGHIAHRFVEDGFGETLRRRIANGVPVMALTARRANNVDVTERALRQIGLDFSQTAPRIDAKEINGMPYVNGVLYVGSTNKGVALNQLLDKSGLRPQRTAFFDDQKKNVDNVVEALTAHGIPIQGFVYNVAARETALHPYRAEIAAYQLRELEAGRVPPSDSAVLRLLQQSDAIGLNSSRISSSCSQLFL